MGMAGLNLTLKLKNGNSTIVDCLNILFSYMIKSLVKGLIYAFLCMGQS